MITSADFREVIKYKVKKDGFMTAVSLPVLRQECGSYYLSVFTIHYTEKDLSVGEMPRPDGCVLADIETGEMIEYRQAYVEDFSSKPMYYRGKMATDIKQSTMHNTFKKAMALFDKIRRELLSTGYFPKMDYETYMAQVLSCVPNDFHIFYRELSMNTNTDILHSYHASKCHNFYLKNDNGEPIWQPMAGLAHITEKELQEARDFLRRGLWVRNFIFKSRNSDRYRIHIWCRPSEYCPVVHEDGYQKAFTTVNAPIIKCDNKECKESQCIPILAGYLQYLKDNGLYEQAMQEREEYLRRYGFITKLYYYDWKLGPTEKFVIALNQADFHTAELLVTKNMVTISNKLQWEDGKLKGVRFTYSLLNSCTHSDGSPQQIAAFAEQATEDDIRKLPKKTMYLKTHNELADILSPDKHMCPACGASICPYKLGAYLRYMMDTGKINELYRLREEHFRKKHPLYWGRKNFAFSLPLETQNHIKTAIREVSEDVLREAVWLVTNRKVSLDGQMTPGSANQMLFKLSTILPSSYMMEDSVPALREMARKTPELDINKAPFTTFPHFASTEYHAGASVATLAAGLDYLLRNNIPFSDALDARVDYIATMEQQKDIVGIDNILKFARSDKANSLFCIVQGEAYSGKTEIIQQIAGVLSDSGKINSMKYIKSSLRSMAESLARSGKKKNGEEYGYLQPHSLYVLTGLSDFLEDYRFYEKNFTFENKMRAYRHMADVLGSVQDDTYVVIVSLNEKDTKEFLSLHEKYGFLYGNNLVIMENMSFDDLYAEYYARLSESVQAQIEDDEHHKAAFLNFIALNEKFLPFKNVELASYLANYSNVNNSPELPPDSYNKKQMEMSLENIVGMEAIKQQVREFENYISFQKKLAVQGGKVSFGNLHMQFLGNPGTGKTTIARIMASMLYSLGILKENKLVEVERKDLVAGYAGQTAMKTADKIKEALGGVLFVDEAYSLYSSDNDVFGKEAISTLIKAMEDHKEDLIVIFAGYDNEMQSFLKANSGIESRIGYSFYFKDYTPDELTEMFRRSITAQGFTCTEEAYACVRDVCEYYSRRKNFGNGRFVKKVEQQTLIKHAQNMGNRFFALTEITEDDIPTVEDLAPKMDVTKTVELLQKLVGLKQVKEQMVKFKNRLEFEAKTKNIGVRLPRGNTHMLFIGNPGTGKTTVARMIALELYQAGVLSTDKCIECSRKDLVASYVGQTAPKTQEMIDRALGGVLFIDEAYSLSAGGNHDFGEEALSTLIKAMEDNKEDFVCIFSGYEKEMKEFVDTNPGVASRIGYTFHFEDYTTDELTEIFENKVSASRLNVADDAKKKVADVMQYFQSVPNFGNGRFADRLAQLAYERHAENCANVSIADRLLTITQEDVPTVEEVIKYLPDGDNMINPEDIKEEQHSRTAFHELGHAVVTKLLFPSNPIERITIAAEGNNALGYVSYKTDGIANKTATELQNQICVSMAGIAAEKVFIGEYGNGGTSDLEKATHIAKAMVTRYGMSKYGFLVRKDDSEQVERESNDILVCQFEHAEEILMQHEDAIRKAHAVLLENKVITQEELEGFLK